MKLFLAFFIVIGFALMLTPADAENYSYSPLRVGHSPDGKLPTDDQIRQDMEHLSGISEKIRVYDTVELEPILKHAQENGILVSVEVSVSFDEDRTRSNIDRIVELNQKYPDTIDSVIVGSNEIFQGHLTLDELISYVDYARDATGLSVTSLNNHRVWESNPKLVEHVDFIMVDSFIQDKGFGPTDSVRMIEHGHDALEKKYPYKKIILETGWSTFDSSKNDQTEFIEGLDSSRLNYFLFEYADEDWQPDPVQSSFGVLTADRTEKTEENIVERYVELLQKDVTTQAATGIIAIVSSLSMLLLNKLQLLGFHGWH
ncbi:hypothetical protein K0U27_00570 [archaeon]|nr:hypothetical protein [archaeon]